jgi:preprotein translocase subunit SecA
MFKWASGILGDSNERELKKYNSVIEEVNEYEADIKQLPDTELRAKTDEFRARLKDGETLNDLMPEAFATAREQIRRSLGERAHDVQLIGAAVLHEGKIAEMKTGEGKTLVATLALYLNGLGGQGAHLITVNDYLAKRDSQWYGRTLHQMGLTISVLQHDAAYLISDEQVNETPNMEYLKPCSRPEAYKADITYGTNHEFGFDFLRDNMGVDVEGRVQRDRHFAIVDEVDNILIDEARTPLIISGPAQDSTQAYQTFARLASGLEIDADYTIDEKARSAQPTEQGIAKIESRLGIDNLYSPDNYKLTRYLDAALKAHAIYQRDREYVVKDGEVTIVDEFTGRLMPGRRWSDGLHQAIEAKERVKVQRESLTYATITLQNYFRLYDKLSGMTGTAVTEAEEFSKIYELDVVVIPTNKPLAREDRTDLIYRNERAKFDAVVEEIEEVHELGRPVLVGTVSIEKSEYLADLLKRKGIKHNVLNAKNHESEAAIVAEAGRLGAVTIATNMAGRGTDIVLGGKRDDSRTEPEWQSEHDKVLEAGGLHIVGTERHEARRIDNQLRGRAGRQGDAGGTRFFVSLEDDIMRRFAPDWLGGMLEKLGMDEDTPLESGMVSKAIEQSQTKVEGHNFDIRKHLVDYDDVMNTHRDVIYKERDKALSDADLKTNFLEMVHEELTELVEEYTPDRYPDEWNLDVLVTELATILKLPSDINTTTLDEMNHDQILERLLNFADEAYEAKEVEIGEEDMRTLERVLLLRTIDGLWVEHLTAMDEMRQGIGLRAYGQTDPLVAYKREAHDMWDQLLAGIRRQIAHSVFHVELTQRDRKAVAGQNAQETRGKVAVGAAAAAASAGSSVNARGAAPGKGRKVGRNQPCPCGSGKKYKKCHGLAA